METGGLEKRGRILEDEFFRRVDQQLSQKLRQKLAEDEQRESLKQACGWADEQLLDTLLAMGITAESLTALMLVPLVQVAWADRQMEPAEKQAILKASEQECPPDSLGWHLLESWLNERPPLELFDVWKQYAHTLLASLSAAQQEQLRAKVLQHAREVASAAGGILGMMKISAQEEKVLSEIEAAMETGNAS